MRRRGRTEGMADAARWLCCQAASHVPGQSIPVDGGTTKTMLASELCLDRADKHESGRLFVRAFEGGG